MDHYPQNDLLDVVALEFLADVLHNRLCVFVIVCMFGYQLHIRHRSDHIHVGSGVVQRLL